MKLSDELKAIPDAQKFLNDTGKVLMQSRAAKIVLTSSCLIAIESHGLKWYLAHPALPKDIKILFTDANPLMGTIDLYLESQEFPRWSEGFSAPELELCFCTDNDGILQYTKGEGIPWKDKAQAKRMYEQEKISEQSLEKRQLMTMLEKMLDLRLQDSRNSPGTKIYPATYWFSMAISELGELMLALEDSYKYEGDELVARHGGSVIDELADVLGTLLTGAIKLRQDGISLLKVPTFHHIKLSARKPWSLDSCQAEKPIDWEEEDKWINGLKQLEREREREAKEKGIDT